MLFTLLGVLIIGLALYETGYGVTNTFSRALQKQILVQSTAALTFILTTHLFLPASYSAATSLFVNLGFVCMLSYIVTATIESKRLMMMCSIITGGLLFPLILQMTEPLGYFTQIEYVDNAGSGLVHFVGGLAALLVSVYTSRKTTSSSPIVVRPYPATLGFLVVWIGWITYVGLISAPIFKMNSNVWLMGIVNMSTSTAWGAVAAISYMWIVCGRIKMRTCTVGGLAGMVAMSADPFSGPVWTAMLIGTVAGISATLCYGWLRYFKMNDPVNAISIHLLPGLIGILSVPFFNFEATIVAQAVAAITLLGIGTCMGVFICELHTISPSKNVPLIR